MDARTDVKKGLPGRHVTEGPERAPQRSCPCAIGLTTAQLHRPFIGVAACWNAACNIALTREARSVKTGVAPGHGTPREFRAIAATGGIAMGGKCSSLPFRRSMELTIRGCAYDDALVGPAGRDKKLPGMITALLRLTVFPIFIYGGSIVSGTFRGQQITVQDRAPAACDIRDAFYMAAGGKVMEPIAAIIRPRDIVTRWSLENAAAVVAASGGSTNAAALHLPAIAHEAGIEFGLSNIAEIFKKTPYVADLKPACRYVAKDMFEARAVPLLMKTLLDHVHLHGDCLTVTGRTIAENLKSVKFNPHQDMVRSTDKPITATGGVVALKGNFAPKGAIVKVAGRSNLRFIPPGRCLEVEEDEAVQTAPPTGQGTGGKIAPITNGRVSVAKEPFCVGHVGPKAKGPIRLLRDGGGIGIDAVAGTLNVKLTDAELTRPGSRWLPSATNHTSGALSKYAQKVGPAAGGAMTHPEGAYEKQCYANI